MDTRYTTTQQVVKLIGSHTISKVTVKIGDLKRTKMVRTINLYYNNRTVQAIVELKNKYVHPCVSLSLTLGFLVRWNGLNVLHVETSVSIKSISWGFWIRKEFGLCNAPRNVESVNSTCLKLYSRTKIRRWMALLSSADVLRKNHSLSVHCSVRSQFCLYAFPSHFLRSSHQNQISLA